MFASTSIVYYYDYLSDAGDETDTSRDTSIATAGESQSHVFQCGSYQR